LEGIPFARIGKGLRKAFRRHSICCHR
jgi:hypothetical protein